jgi:NAD(P)H-nitrite reductase large subunit
MGGDSLWHAFITLDPQRQVVFTASGENIAYHHLVWAADLKTFYESG